MADTIKNITIRSSAAEYLTYVAATGDNPQSIEMRYEDENIWLTQKMLAVLYDVETATINEHLKHIFNDKELSEGATIRNFLIVQIEGSRYVISPTYSHDNGRLEDWKKRLDAFLQFNEEEILNDAGRVTHEIAKSFAESEFEKYRIIQDQLYQSDYDRFAILENCVKTIQKMRKNQDHKNTEMKDKKIF